MMEGFFFHMASYFPLWTCDNLIEGLQQAKKRQKFAENDKFSISSGQDQLTLL